MNVKGVIFILLMLCCTTLFGQRLKRMVVKSKQPESKEVFYVLRKDRDTRHGPYKKKVKGELAIKGQFVQGEKAGLWAYYDWQGTLVQQYNFTTDSVLFDYTLLNFDAAASEYSRPPLLLGSAGTLSRLLQYRFHYPVEAVEAGVAGQILLKADVSAEGEASNFRVLQGLGHGMDEEAIRVYRMVKDEFIPAKNKKGEHVASEIILPLTFRLQ